MSRAIVGALLLGSMGVAVAQQGPQYDEQGQVGDADSWKTDEFNADWGLGVIGAHHAYARGLTGRGVRIGVIDGGSAFGHGDFANGDHRGIRMADPGCENRIALNGPDACYMADGDQPGIDYFHYTDEDRAFIQFLIDIGYLIPDADEILESWAGFAYNTHGTHVAGTIAANRNGQGSHGVAFGADLTAARMFSNSYMDLDALLGWGGESYSIGPGDAAFADVFAQMAAQGVRAINHSWGLSQEPTTAEDMDWLYNAPGVAEYLSIFTNAGIRDGMIQVWAAGNASGNIAGLYATLPRWVPDAEKYWLSVVNVNQTGEIDGSSSTCGLSMDWCIAAPGTDITSTVVGGGIEGEVVYDDEGNVVGLDITSENPEYGHGDLTGTSMAAPHITGALALLMERYPYLDNPQIRDILLTTARDLGEEGVDAIYGWGLLDLQKAIEGYGQFRVDTDVVMNSRAGGAKVWEGLAWDDWTNDIGGPGRLTKSGIGWLRLSGDNSFNGATIAEGILELDGENALSGNVEVDGGALILNGSLLDTDLLVTDGSALVYGQQVGGSTHVGVDGRLLGTGTLGDTVVTGAIAPGVSLGTLTIDGDLDLSSSSIFELELDSDESDLLYATGTATLAGGTLQIAQVPGSYLLGQYYEFLSADGGVSGAFGTVDSSSISPFLDFNLVYGTDYVALDVVRGMALADAAVTANQRAVGASADALAMDHVLAQRLTQLFPEQALPALDSLSGELHASAQSVLVDSQRHVREAALARSQAGTGAFAPMATGEAGPAAWIEVLRSGGTLQTDGNAGRVDYSGNATLLGVDYRFANGWRVGVLGGMDRNDMSVDGRGTDGDIIGRHVGLYAGQAWGGLGLRMGVTHAQGEVDVQRTVAFPGVQDQTHVEYDTQSTQAFIEAGYRFAANAWEIEPYLQYAHVSYEIDGFQEEGGVTALRGTGTEGDIGLATAGVRFNLNLKGAQQEQSWLSLRGGLGYRDATGDLSPAATVAWQGGDAFVVRGAPLADGATVAELGFGARVGESSLFELTYSGQYADEARDHGLNARFSMRF
ncbi:autotransporter domain-containing protein [Lysobacter sp. A3-1-A15]|uniref:autotransporter domain-containing protein n=1 Tax=Novilysobacter viscosus TaxID=3098602 RepID=UPI002EDAFE7A